MSKNVEPPENIDWSSPPPSKTRGRKAGSKWDPIAAQLRANPGRWACIGRSIPTGIVTTIRGAEVKCFQPKGSFEVAVRNYTSRWVADVFVRYIGDGQEYA